MNKKAEQDWFYSLFMMCAILFLFWAFWCVELVDKENNSNREVFCKSQEMSLSDDNKYCFDGIEKMYWIEPIGYESRWYLLNSEIETKFKLVKEVVTLEGELE